MVGLYLQLLGLRSQAGIWSRSLGGLKTPHKRACKSAGRTILTSALLHLISLSFSLSLYMLDFDVFLAQKTAKCNYGLTLKGGESLRQRHKHVYCDAKNVFTHLFHALLFYKDIRLCIDSESHKTNAEIFSMWYETSSIISAH